MLRKLFGILLILSLAANIAGLAIFDRALFYRDKIAVDEGGFLNEGLRITSPAAISEADFPNLGALLGGSLFRYWFAPVIKNSQLVNYGGLEEKSADTYAKMKMVAADMTPKFVVINAGFCEIHTAVHTGGDVEKAFDSNMHYLRLMVNEAQSHGIIPIISSLPPVRSKYLMPYSGLIDLPSEEKTIEIEAIQTYNSQMKQFAMEEDLLFYDFHQILAGGSGKLRKKFSLIDGEHLNWDGYRVMNEFLVDQLVNMRSQSKL